MPEPAVRLSIRQTAKAILGTYRRHFGLLALSSILPLLFYESLYQALGSNYLLLTLLPILPRLVLQAGLSALLIASLSALSDSLV